METRIGIHWAAIVQPKLRRLQRDIPVSCVRSATVVRGGIVPRPIDRSPLRTSGLEIRNLKEKNGCRQNARIYGPSA